MKTLPYSHQVEILHLAVSTAFINTWYPENGFLYSLFELHYNELIGLFLLWLLNFDILKFSRSSVFDNCCGRLHFFPGKCVYPEIQWLGEPLRSWRQPSWHQRDGRFTLQSRFVRWFPRRLPRVREVFSQPSQGDRCYSPWDQEGPL